jgi:hypothetical protein
MSARQVGAKGAVSRKPLIATQSVPFIEKLSHIRSFILMHRIYTAVLWCLVVVSLLPLVGGSALMGIFGVLCGLDSPQTKLTEYLLLVILPFAIAFTAFFLAWLSLYLWRLERWNVLAFPIALSLVAGNFLAMIWLSDGSRGADSGEDQANLSDVQ